MMVIAKNLLGAIKPETPVYRIFARDRFLQLLRTAELVLPNPSLWEDPFENFFLQAPVRLPDGRLATLRDLASKWYGQCWTFNRDTDAMWRIYSGPEKTGVRVRSTVGKLFDVICDPGNQLASLQCFAGAVEYRPRSWIEQFLQQTSFLDVAFGGQNDGFARLLCVKREEFSHEAEMRLLFCDVGDLDQPSIDLPPFRPFRIDVPSVIDEVTLDPRLDDTEYARAQDELRFAGCPGPILQSELYRVTFSPIRSE